MIDLEKARLELGLHKCAMAIAEYEFKILERQKDIERLKGLIDEQEKQRSKILEQLKKDKD